MSISTRTTWEEDYEPAGFPRLTEDLEADIAIVGGGLTGILSAYLLAKDGRKVVVLEADRIGRGATLYTTGFVTSSVDTDATDLVPMFGMRDARLIRESHEAAIGLIEGVCGDEGIECGFARCSSWIFARAPGEEESLLEEYRALKGLGYDVVFHDTLANGFSNGGAIEVKNQAKFHPLRFLQGLASRAADNGVRILEHARVTGIKGDGPVRVESGPHAVSAREAIIATYDPLGNPWRTFGKKGMYVSYVLEAGIPQGALAEGTYENTGNPYHYFRVDRGNGKDRLILGGEDHRRELPLGERKAFAALREYLDELMGEHAYTVTRQWSGPILESSDGLPLIGRLAPGRLVATAFSGNGMTYAAVAAMTFRDLVAGRSSPWTALYDPRRVPSLGQLLRKGRDYAAELFRGVTRILFR